jgi:hypothetical protein
MTNPDSMPVELWGEVYNASGIAEMAYIPPFKSTPNATSAWPELGTMISSGKRVVIYMDYGANQTVVPFILDEFTYMWETPFDQTNASFPCTINRPPGLTSATGRLATVNHFLDIELPDDILLPDQIVINQTNGVSGYGSLGLQAAQCAALYGSYPNFFLVDCSFLVRGGANCSLRRVEWIRFQGRSATQRRSVHCESQFFSKLHFQTWGWLELLEFISASNSG